MLSFDVPPIPKMRNAFKPVLTCFETVNFSSRPNPLHFCGFYAAKMRITHLYIYKAEYSLFVSLQSQLKLIY